MDGLLALLLSVAAMGALHTSADGFAQTEDVTSSSIADTAPVVVSVSTSVTTSVSSSSEPAASTVSLPDTVPSSGEELDVDESSKYKLYTSPQQKASRPNRDNLSASARLRQKLFPAAARQEAADDALNQKVRIEKIKLRKTNEREHASQEGITSSTTLGPEIYSNQANILGPALLAKEIASVRSLESQEHDEKPRKQTDKISSNFSHFRIPRKFPTVSQTSSTTTDAKFESKIKESRQNIPTTFSDLIKERFPDSKPPTIVKQIQPAFKSILRSEFSNDDLALYGKELSIQKATLEKEIINFKGTEKPKLRLRTAAPSQKENNEVVLPKTAFKKRDIEDMPKKWMQVVKQLDARWVAEQEAGVMLPAADGSGTAFVPEILIEDTEFLLSMPPKVNSRGSERQSENSTAVHEEKHLNRPGRDAHVMGGMPYSFGYIVDDEHTDNFQTRYEEGDVNGVVNGCYQVLEPTGLVRTVIYKADRAGFTVLSVSEDPEKLPCSGLDSAGQFSALSASSGYRVKSSPNILSSNFKSSFSSEGSQDFQVHGNKARQPSSEIFNSPSHFPVKDSPQNSLQSHGSDHSFGDYGRSLSSSIDQSGHLQPSIAAGFGPDEQLISKNIKQNQLKALNFDLNKSSFSHSLGSSFSNLENKSNFNGQYQSTAAFSPHIHRNIRHEQNQRKTQPKAIQSSQHKQNEHKGHFGTKEAFFPQQGFQKGSGTRSSFSLEPQSSNEAKVDSSIHEKDHTLKKQEEMSKYLQSLSDELYSSFSESSLAAATSSDTLINFPFVLIPVSTFMNLRNEGHIHGDVQSFGAFIQPVQNSVSAHKYGNKHDTKYSSKSLRSQATPTDNKLPLFHIPSKEPALAQPPNFNINHKNDQPQDLNSHFPSQRSTRGSRTVFPEKHTPRPFTSYPKVTSIASPLLPTKVSFSSPTPEDTFKSQNRQLNKINEIKNLYHHFRYNKTELSRNKLFTANLRDSFTKPVTTLPFSVSQSSVFADFYDPKEFFTQSGLNVGRSSPDLSSNYLPLRALSAFVRTAGDFEPQNTIGTHTTHTPTESVTAAPLSVADEVTQKYQSDLQPQFDVTYNHVPKGRPPLTNYGYSNHDNLRSDSIETYPPLASSSPFHDPAVSDLPPFNEIEESSPASGLLPGNIKTLAGKQAFNKRAPVPTYLASLSDLSLPVGKSILGRSRATKRESNQRRQPRTLQLSTFDNDIQVPVSAGKFKPPKKLESMVDSPLIRSSDWIPILHSPRARLTVRAPREQDKTRSVVENLSRREKNLASPDTSVDRLASHLAKKTRNFPGSSKRISGRASDVSFSFPQTSISDLRQAPSALPEPISTSAVSEIEFTLPHTPPTFILAARNPSTSKRQAKDSGIEPEAHATNESFEAFIEGKPAKGSFSAVEGERNVRTAKNNDGFGKFHTRESSKKVNPIDGSEFNSHFYSQVN